MQSSQIPRREDTPTPQKVLTTIVLENMLVHGCNMQETVCIQCIAIAGSIVNQSAPNTTHISMFHQSRTERIQRNSDQISCFEDSLFSAEHCANPALCALKNHRAICNTFAVESLNLCGAHGQQGSEQGSEQSRETSYFLRQLSTRLYAINGYRRSKLDKTIALQLLYTVARM